MNRATPVQIRKCLEAAKAMVQAGIQFVPMPVLGDGDLEALQTQMIERLEKMEADAQADDAEYESAEG